MNKLLRIVVLVGWTVLASGIALAADKERNPKPDPNALEMVLARIRGHAAKNDWQADGWSDATIETWLETTTAVLATASGQPNYKLPVKFADVRAVDPKNIRLAIQGGGLIVGSNVKITHANRHLILADGNADVSFADNCVIVARGVVSIAHCNNSLIVAGSAVEISHDGNGIRGAGAGSMVLCRGWVDISHCQGTCVLAHEGITVSHARGATFFGPEPKTSSRDAACQVVKLPMGFPVEPRPEDPLEKKLEILGAVKPKGIVFRFDGKRYTADLNQPIVDESGMIVAALTGWKVSFVGDELAVISNGQVDVPFRLPEGQ